MIYLIGYDIADSHRLYHLSKKIEDIGIRQQKSFFECDLSECQKNKLVQELLAILNEQEDSLFILPLCENCLDQIVVVAGNNCLQRESFQIL